MLASLLLFSLFFSSGSVSGYDSFEDPSSEVTIEKLDQDSSDSCRGCLRRFISRSSPEASTMINWMAYFIPTRRGRWGIESSVSPFFSGMVNSEPFFSGMVNSEPWLMRIRMMMSYELNLISSSMLLVSQQQQHHLHQQSSSLAKYS